jgi:hypothetical protein
LEILEDDNTSEVLNIVVTGFAEIAKLVGEELID